MTHETAEKLALLILGWLLGLLAPAIVDGIKKTRENKLGRAAIRVELTQLRERLILAAYMADEHLGTQTREKIQWALERLESRGDDKVRGGMKMRLSLPDEQFDALVANLAGQGTQSVRMQNYGTPLLDARVSALWSFSTESQRTLIQLKTEMGFLEDAVAQSRFFNELTFKDLSSENYKIVVQSVKDHIATYATRARRAVYIIEKFL